MENCLKIGQLYLLAAILLHHIPNAIGVNDLEGFDLEEVPRQEPPADAEGFEQQKSVSSFSSSKKEQRFHQDENGNMVMDVDNNEQLSGHSRDQMSRKFRVKDGKTEFFEVKSKHESGPGPLSDQEMSEFDVEQQKLEEHFEQEQAKLEKEFAAAYEQLKKRFQGIVQ